MAQPIITVLTPFVASEMGTARTLLRVKSNLEGQLQQKSEVVANAYGVEIGALTREADSWREISKSVGGAAATLGEAVDRARAIRLALNNLLTLVEQAEDDAAGAATYAKAFQSAIKSLNNAAKGGTGGSLLGPSGTRQLTYDINPSGATETVYGAFVGVDNYIVDSAGKRWVLDRDTGVLQRYDTWPSDDAIKSVDAANGIQIDSISGDSITFTTGASTAGSEQFTGTIYRQGLGVLDSWLYENLGTAAGRARAREDIATAKTAIDLEISRYEIAKATALYYQTRADFVVSGFDSQVQDKLAAQDEELTKLQGQFARQFNLVSNGIVNALAIQAEYSKFFASSRHKGLTQALLNLRA